MQSLELKIPPPIIALIVAVAMWGVSRIGPPPIEVSTAVRQALAAVLALAGVATIISGLRAFRRARTTIDPRNPQKTAALVTTGVYRLTRNPMYVGFIVVLLGWAEFLFSPWALAGPLAFLLYIGRFQIEPEERALMALFGGAFSAYASRVRRWV